MNGTAPVQLAPRTEPACKVLIIKPSSLGDVVHTLPALRALKRARPNWSISWLVNSEWAPLLEGNPDLDGVIHFPRNEFRGLVGLSRLRHWLKSAELGQPDLALDFQGLTRSALLSRWSKACRIHCLANAELPARLLAHSVASVVRDQHAVNRYLGMVEQLGIPVDGAPEFVLPEGIKPGVELPERFLLLHPFSRGPGKSLSEPVLQELCERLAPMPVVIAGRSEIGFKAPVHCINLLNRTTLEQLLWLIRRAAFTASVDSGPMHMAAAITPQLLGIHTWSDPRRVGPCQPEAWVWKNGIIQQVKAIGGPISSSPFEMKHVPAVVEFLRRQL